MVLKGIYHYIGNMFIFSMGLKQMEVRLPVLCLLGWPSRTTLVTVLSQDAFGPINKSTLPAELEALVKKV